MFDKRPAKLCTAVLTLHFTFFCADSLTKKALLEDQIKSGKEGNLVE